MAFWKDNGSTLIKERRKPMPPVQKAKITLGIITWVSLFLSYLIIDSMHPSTFMVPIIDSKYGKEGVYIPHPIYSKVAFALCIFALLLSIANTILMFKYNKRKSDKISPAILAALAVSFIATIYFAFNLL